MTTKVNFILTKSGALTLWFKDPGEPTRQYTVAVDHPQHRRIVEKLKVGDFKTLETLVSTKAAVEVANKEFVAAAGSASKVAVIKDGIVYLNGAPVNNVVTERILQLARGGYPVAPALRFLENISENPSSRAVSELYDFLANRNLPLTEDGHFLAYKRIRSDWLDIYSATIDNSVGNVVEVERNSVDDDRTHECSHGLHVGALEYVRQYGNGPNTRVVIVKVNPRDCVSVPRDYSHMKLRVCRYEVLYELSSGDQVALENPMYSTNGQRFDAVDDWIDEEADPDLDYLESGWDDDYDTWSKDALAYECVNRNLCATRQEGRDIGADGMKELLRENDSEVEEELARMDEEDEEEDCGGCELCDEHLGDSEEEAVEKTYVGEKYVFVKNEHPLTKQSDVGTIVTVTDNSGFFITYTPGLTSPKYGMMQPAMFEKCFVRVK